MATRLDPYIEFQGNAREAMEYYKSIFGGELRMNTYEEFQAAENPADKDKIMHSQLEAENGISFMAADSINSAEYRVGTNFSMTLSGENHEELQRYFERLAADGSVEVPLEKAPWGDHFGMVKDKYGVKWMVNINGQQGA